LKNNVMNETIELLESKYRKFAEAYGEATRKCNPKLANKNYAKLIALIPKIKTYGEEGESALLRLMNDPEESVASWAAAYSLPFAESDALRVLDALAGKGGQIGHEAGMVAEQWRSGELELP
jgi:hypothetical protein